MNMNMEAINIGSFKLGGIEWNIEIDNDWCSQAKSKWGQNYSLQIIKLRDRYDKVQLDYSNIERELWDAIINIAIVSMMEYRKLDYNNIIRPYSSLLLQALTTYSGAWGEWDGEFKLGATTYTVSVNNLSLNDEGAYGMHYGDYCLIELGTENNGTAYTDEFVYQTLLHEMLHAVATELGRNNEKINSEKFVNTLATFIYEVKSTLKLNFPDETD